MGVVRSFLIMEEVIRMLNGRNLDFQRIVWLSAQQERKMVSFDEENAQLVSGTAEQLYFKLIWKLIMKINWFCFLQVIFVKYDFFLIF